MHKGSEKLWKSIKDYMHAMPITFEKLLKIFLSRSSETVSIDNLHIRLKKLGILFDYK